MTIVNDDSRVINNLETSLTDSASVIIYDRHIFIVQATDARMQLDSKTSNLGLLAYCSTNCATAAGQAYNLIM